MIKRKIPPGSASHCASAGVFEIAVALYSGCGGPIPCLWRRFQPRTVRWIWAVGRFGGQHGDGGDETIAGQVSKIDFGGI